MRVKQFFYSLTSRAQELSNYVRYRKILSGDEQLDKLPQNSNVCLSGNWIFVEI